MFLFSFVVTFLLSITILILMILFVLKQKKINSLEFWGELFGLFISLLFCIISLANITNKKVLKLGYKSITITKKTFFVVKKLKFIILEN